jgi:hypothetical protein
VGSGIGARLKLIRGGWGQFMNMMLIVNQTPRGPTSRLIAEVLVINWGADKTNWSDCVS